jgi:hypothetical protein
VPETSPTPGAQPAAKISKIVPQTLKYAPNRIKRLDDMIPLVSPMHDHAVNRSP